MCIALTANPNPNPGPGLLWVVQTQDKKRSLAYFSSYDAMSGEGVKNLALNGDGFSTFQALD